MLVADIDGDGSIDTGLRMTAPVAQVQADPVHPTKYIEYDVHQSDTLAGTYTSWRRFTSAAEVSIDTLLDVKANANKWYKARYRLITFSGAKTAWSPLTSPGVQPASYANTMPTVLWQASNPIVAKPKAIWLRWQAISASLTHAKEIVVFRHTANNSATAVEIGTAPSGAQRYIDNDDLVAGTTYFYGLKARDRANNVSASFSTVQSVAWRTASAVASDGDFDTTALAAPTISSHAQDNKDLNTDGVVDMAATVVLPLGRRRVELTIMARRFWCDAVLCGRRIFCEQLEDCVLARYARRTQRLDTIVHHLGLALGGRPAAALQIVSWCR